MFKTQNTDFNKKLKKRIEEIFMIKIRAPDIINYKLPNCFIGPFYLENITSIVKHEQSGALLDKRISSNEGYWPEGRKIFLKYSRKWCSVDFVRSKYKDRKWELDESCLIHFFDHFNLEDFTYQQKFSVVKKNVSDDFKIKVVYSIVFVLAKICEPSYLFHMILQLLQENAILRFREIL